MLQNIININDFIYLYTDIYGVKQLSRQMLSSKFGILFSILLSIWFFLIFRFSRLSTRLFNFCSPKFYAFLVKWIHLQSNYAIQ